MISARVIAYLLIGVALALACIYFALKMLRSVGSYGVVSGICFALNNALLIALAALPLWLNLSLSAAVVIGTGYVLQSWLTFRASLSWDALGRYSLVMLPNVPIAYLMLWALGLWLPMAYAAPLVTTAFLVWNAVGSVWALRRRRAMETP